MGNAVRTVRVGKRNPKDCQCLMAALMHIYNDEISSDGSGMLGDKSSASERRFHSASWHRLRLPEQASLGLACGF
jgi:hypothetical protein